MLLRRVIEHIEDQNWTAVIIDFLIVVVGVVIGIQVANLNTARLENKMEQGYLVRLHEDFADSVLRTQEIIEGLDFQVQAQNFVIESLESCTLPAEAVARFEAGVYSLGFINPPRLVRRTIDELKASGRLDLIQSETLKAALAAAVNDTEFRAAVTESVLRRVERHRFIVAGFVFYEEASPALRYDLEEICESPAAIRAVSAIRASTIERKEAYGELISRYNAVLPAIESELSARWGATIQKRLVR